MIKMGIYLLHFSHFYKICLEWCPNHPELRRGNNNKAYWTDYTVLRKKHEAEEFCWDQKGAPLFRIESQEEAQALSYEMTFKPYGKYSIRLDWIYLSSKFSNAWK